MYVISRKGIERVSRNLYEEAWCVLACVFACGCTSVCLISAEAAATGQDQMAATAAPR